HTRRMVAVALFALCFVWPAALKAKAGGPSAVKGRSTAKSSSGTCLPCEAAAARSKKRKASKAKTKEIPCHPSTYLDPKVAGNYRTAVLQMKRAGIKPKVTSMWRSSDYQNQLHKCSLNSKCRSRRGIYSAMPSGQSLHEAGFAVDISDVATGSRG